MGSKCNREGLQQQTLMMVGGRGGGVGIEEENEKIQKTG